VKAKLNKMQSFLLNDTMSYSFQFVRLPSYLCLKIIRKKQSSVRIIQFFWVFSRIFKPQLSEYCQVEKLIWLTCWARVGKSVVTSVVEPELQEVPKLLWSMLNMFGGSVFIN
jgi:hypothetical protein